MAAAKAMISPELGELLAARAELVLDPPGPTALSRADVFLASSHFPLSAADLECATRLAVVTQVGTAVHVDVAAATRLGIPVLHNRGRNADSVAEHTIALLLAVAKNIVRGDAEVRSRVHWDVAAPHLVNHELRGKTLGIAGFGAVGQRVADIASLGFGMRVLGCDAVPGVVTAHGYEELVLDDLLPRVDVLSLHLAATSQTLADQHGPRRRPRLRCAGRGAVRRTPGRRGDRHLARAPSQSTVTPHRPAERRAQPAQRRLHPRGDLTNGPGHGRRHLGDARRNDP